MILYDFPPVYSAKPMDGDLLAHIEWEKHGEYYQVYYGRTTYTPFVMDLYVSKTSTHEYNQMADDEKCKVSETDFSLESMDEAEVYELMEEFGVVI